MGAWRSAEEVEKQYVERMGPELGKLFHTLSAELTWVHWRWKQYRVLFGENPVEEGTLSIVEGHAAATRGFPADLKGQRSPGTDRERARASVAEGEEGRCDLEGGAGGGKCVGVDVAGNRNVPTFPP